MKEIIIIGMGGHAKSITDTIEKANEYKIIGYVSKEKNEGLNYPYIGDDEMLCDLYRNGISYAALGIGFLGKGNLRQRLYEKLKKIGYVLPAIVDISANVSNYAEINEGAFIGKNTVVNRKACIGKCSIINTSAIVEHDSIVGDFSHIAVGAVICGDVHIGKSTLVGANATIIQQVNIGDNKIIGAGEIVKRDIL